MSLKSTINFITNHPLTKNKKVSTVIRFLKWQLFSRIIPYPIIYTFIGNSKLIIKKGMAGATGNYYVGLHEFVDMSFLLHALTDSDTFVDIGANIGSYTVLASGYKKCKTIAIEPIPTTFKHLTDNIAINSIEKLCFPLNIGLGSQKGHLKFTENLDTVNHILSKDEDGDNTLLIPVNTLDNILANESPILLKIDVEGYEMEVLLGGKTALQNTSLKAIIIELNGSGSRYGFNEEEIHKLLLSYGFTPYIYNPYKRDLQTIDYFGTHNTIYIRDINFIKKRVTSSPAFTIFEQSI